MIRFLDEKLFSLQWPWPLVIIIGAMVLFAIAAYLKKSLDLGGAAGAFVMGVSVLWSTGFAGFLLLLLFFVSSNVVGKISKHIRTRGKMVEISEKKGHTRDVMQVLANGLMATIAALMWLLTSKNIALVMFGAAVAEATADTFAGEIGRLSSRDPVSILTLKPVPRGVSGGVTVLGMVAAMGASVCIAACWCLWFSGVTVYQGLLVGLLGFAGAVVDSYLGAGVQAMYLDPDTGLPSEKEEKDGRKLELVRGIRWIDNDMVNLMSNVFSAVFALGMGLLIGG
ncbi:MAG: DUF92 domain-containing protein [Spirochaetales bacterium]|nr:DUF92 domain-containing protein [Spirochaetales bacterium]